MGEIYRARDTKLNRDVALKILPSEFALDAEQLARFNREVQVLASLAATIQESTGNDRALSFDAGSASGRGRFWCSGAGCPRRPPSILHLEYSSPAIRRTIIGTDDRQNPHPS
jgi:serine/threonine protein kinase